MSLSHQNREDETLLDYFKQMLAVEVREIDKAQVPPPPSSTNLESKPQVPQMEDFAKEEVYKPQLQKIEKEEVLPKVEFAEAPSLEQLLSTIESTEAQETTVVTEPKVETKTQEQSAVDTQTKPLVETKNQEVVPKTQTELATTTESVTDTQVATGTETQRATETQVKVESKVEVAPQVETKAQTQKVASKQEEKIAKVLTQEGASQESREVFETWQNIEIGREFQTLFFVVGVVRFAVPLIDLGSIFETTKLTYIFGQPNWFLGMTDIRGKKINVVDTLRFVKEDYAGREEPYPYIITLGTSRWALTCDKLEGNRTILKDAVKWRQSAGSRPWLAGIVKEQMCALIHVQALIKLFESGFNPRMLDQIKDLS